MNPFTDIIADFFIFTWITYIYVWVCFEKYFSRCVN